MLLPLESAILHKKERYFFTSPGPKSEMFSIIRSLLKHEAKRKITKKLWTASRNTSSSKRMLRWPDKTFLAATPLAGETINNFVTHLQKLTELAEQRVKGTIR